MSELQMLTRETRTNLDSPEIVRLWQARIDTTMQRLNTRWNGYRQWNSAYLWDRVIDWSSKRNPLTTHASEDKDIRGRMSFPLVATHVRNLLPFLIPEDPMFYATPPTEELANTVLAQMDYLNHIWRSQGMTRQVRRSLMDTALIGHGVLKTGWVTTEEIEEQTTPERGTIIYNKALKAENPWVERINPFLFLFDIDSSGRDLETARWACQIIPKRLGEVLDNESYDSAIRSQLERTDIGTQHARDFMRSKFDNIQLGDEELDEQFAEDTSILLTDRPVILYEVWDRKFNVVHTLLEGYTEKPLKIVDWPHASLSGFPFIKTDFEEVPNEPYGIGHARYLADVQKAQNRLMSKMVLFVDQINPFWVHKGEGKLDPNEETKIRQNLPHSVVNIDQGSNLESIVANAVAEDLLRVFNMLDTLYSEISGQDVLARGGLLPSRTSAEEIRERSRLRGLRLETNVVNARDTIKLCGHHILAHATDNLTQEKLIPVIGRPARFWKPINKESLQSTVNITLDIQVTTKPEQPPEQTRRQLLELLQVLLNPNLLQLMQQSGAQLDFAQLIYTILATFNNPALLNAAPNMMAIPEGFQPVNTGTQPALDNNTSPESTRNIQSDNGNPNLAGQQGGVNIQSILNQLHQGGQPQ